MNMISDDFLYNSMEHGQEAKAVEVCEFCGEDLFEGQEVLKDLNDNYFCDESCVKCHLDIEDGVELPEELENESCPSCTNLLTNEYETIKNGWNEYFCSIECAFQDAGIEEVIL